MAPPGDAQTPVRDRRVIERVPECERGGWVSERDAAVLVWGDGAAAVGGSGFKDELGLGDLWLFAAEGGGEDTMEGGVG